MQTYIVLYRDQEVRPGDAPLAFVCQADDTDHAEEQTLDAYPDAEIMWIAQTADPDTAYRQYWGIDAD